MSADSRHADVSAGLSLPPGPSARFLSGEDDDPQLTVLTNDDFSLLHNYLFTAEFDPEFPEAEEFEGIGETEEQPGQKKKKPLQKRSTTREKIFRRSKEEVKEYFAKHALRRKLSSSEMAQFMESRKRRRKDCYPPSAPMITITTAPAALANQKRVWSELGAFCNSYDLDRLQHWMETRLSPSLVFRIHDAINLGDMVGSIYLAHYMAVLLGAFPACSFDYDVMGATPEALNAHANFFAWAQERAGPEFSSLVLEKTSCFRVVGHFDGLRICYYNLWDVMASDIQKRLSTPQPLSGNEMHEFLHGENSIYCDFIRESDESRSDGKTTAKVTINTLIDDETGLILAVEMTAGEFSCPILDELAIT